jgi:hypothetical protein
MTQKHWLSELDELERLYQEHHGDPGYLLQMEDIFTEHARELIAAAKFYHGLHRVHLTMCERILAGEPEAEVFEDYGYTRADINGPREQLANNGKTMISCGRLDCGVCEGCRLQKENQTLRAQLKTQQKCEAATVARYNEDEQKLLALLRRSEWCAIDLVGKNYLEACCHICGKTGTKGHAPNCELAAALKDD